MIEHEHDPVLQLDGLILCRTCGKFLPYMEEIIAVATSQRRMNLIMQEIAVAGHYVATTFENGYVVYSRVKDSNQEEIVAKKHGIRSYKIMKRVTSVDH